MTTKHCRGCGAVLTAANDSEAHIIPKALGGRLKPKGIICQTCNTALDKLADNALIKAFGDWPTLLDVPREGGGNPTKIIDTRNGRHVRLQLDGTLTAMNVKYEVTPIEDGHAVEITAGDMKTIRQLLQRPEKQFPIFDAKAAEQHAKTMGVNDGDELKMHLDFTGIAVVEALTANSVKVAQSVAVLPFGTHIRQSKWVVFSRSTCQNEDNDTHFTNSSW